MTPTDDFPDLPQPQQPQDDELNELKTILDEGGLQSDRIYPKHAFDKALSSEIRHKVRMDALNAALESVSGMNAVRAWMERERDELAESASVLVRKAALARDTKSLAAMGYELCHICGGDAHVCSACMGMGVKKL